MKKQGIFSCLLTMLFFFIFNASLPGQSDTRYMVFQYVKVHPSMENEYLQLEIDVWKKIHQERIRQDLLDGWFLYRVISPNGSNTEYNFILELDYDSPEKLAGHFESFGVDYKDILDSDEIASALKTPDIRDQVYEEVWTSVDEISQENPEELYRFQVFNAMALKPGVTEDEYLETEEKYWKPMHEMRIRMNRMYGWALYNMIIPGGTEREFHWATVDYYDRFIDILADNDPIMINIHGNKYDDYLQETLETRDLLWTEVRELLDYVDDDMDK